jgi:hypothetical protein
MKFSRVDMVSFHDPNGEEGVCAKETGAGLLGKEAGAGLLGKEAGA